MKTYRVHFGKSPEHFHSHRDFSKESDALAYLWALANAPKFERVWYWQGLDGWLRNDHLHGKPYPNNLANQIENFIEEEKGIHTMKVKTSELSGAPFNWAVAKCEGLKEEDFVLIETDNLYGPQWVGPEYSIDWSYSGPIIERERIAIGFDRFCDIDCGLAIWSACKYNDLVAGYGPTPLIAAMRCYVASKLGDEVEIPSELMEVNA